LSSRTWTSAWYNYWGVVYNGVPAYQQMTGISKWRMPTLAEAKTAHAHNAYNYFSQTGDTTVAPSWVSDMKGKKQAYYFGYHNGQSVLTSINSVLAFRLVYRP
jgi:polyferredoxin